MMMTRHVRFVLLLVGTLQLVRAGGFGEAAAEHARPFKLFGAIIDPRRPPRPVPGQHEGSTSRPFDIVQTSTARPPSVEDTVGPGSSAARGQKRTRSGPSSEPDERALALQRYASNFPPHHFVQILAKHPTMILKSERQPSLPPTAGVVELERIRSVLSTARHKSGLTVTAPVTAKQSGRRDVLADDPKRANEDLERISHASLAKFISFRQSPHATPESIEHERQRHVDVKAKVMANRFHLRAWNNVDQLTALLERERHRGEEGLAENTQAGWAKRLEEAKAGIEREFGPRDKPPFELRRGPVGRPPKQSTTLPAAI